MQKSIKILISFLPFLFTAFNSTEENKTVEYYYNLQSIKEAQGPRQMKVIKTDNIEKGKSLIEPGVLITYKNRYTNDVKIAGDFSNWKLVEMSKGKYGIWYYFLTDPNSKKITRYKLMVNGIWIIDPMNTDKEDDNCGSYVSVIQPVDLPESNNLTYRFIGRHHIEFRIYKPEARFVSLVGDFNNWNPENDLMEKKKTGVWILKKRLPPGIYKYKYIVDGNWILDLYNKRTAGDTDGDICSIIRIKK